MKNFTFKRQLLFVMFMLLGCLSIQAADDGLITKQMTIELNKAGTLPDRISESKKYLITNLKIVGEVNGTDWLFIREMAGSDLCGDKTDGKLSILDLSDAKIVGGGLLYFLSEYTSNDKLGDYAFYGCSGLTSLTIPSSVTSIGASAFEGCCGLTSLTIPSSVTSIGGSAFAGCSGLTSLVIPSSVTSIGWSAFSGCSGLTSLTIPSSVTMISGEVFSGCSGLTSLVIPSSVTLISRSAFEYCSGLTSIYVYAEKVPKIDSKAFEGFDAKKCTLYVPMGTRDDYWVSNFGDYFENIVEFDATGIDKTTISTDVEEVARYSVNGQRLSAPTKGLNIVKYSDGSVKKVAVR